MKKKVDPGEFVFLGALLCYVAYYFFTMWGYSVKTVLWPFCLMGAAVLAVAGVAAELVRKAPAAEPLGEPGKKQAYLSTLREAIVAKGPILVVIASFLLYTLLLKKLGLHLCNFLLGFFLVLYLTKGRWKAAVLTATCLTLGFFLVFDLALGLRLPAFKLF